MPVSLVGTFVLFPVFGFSINTISLLALVLAIGIVVDDAIVVVEAVEHHIEHGLSPRDATLKAMSEVSGPVVAIALIVQYMASGFGWAAQRMRIDYHGMIGWGVLIAAMTGLGAWVVGHPFLTSTVWHLGLPVLGEIHVASAMFFDVGVFLVVVGATMLALANLSRVSRRAESLPINLAPMDVDPSQAVAAKEG